MGVNYLDLFIFLLYIVLLFLIGIRSARKRKDSTAEDFFLTSNNLPWYAIGFAIIAAGISSEQFLGTVGYAYKYGMAVANWEWLNGPAIFILVFIFVPFYIRRKVVTMPQFLEMRYDGRVRVLFAVITLLTYVFINLAGVIFSGGYALNKIFGIDLYLGMWSMALIAGMLIIYGGMESVAWTNVFQSVLLLGSGLLVFIIGLFEVPGGFNAIIGEGERARLILPSEHTEIPWTGLLVLAFSTNIWFFCTNQTINQAALGAKTEWHARAGILLAGLLTIVIVMADVFPGLIAFALEPGLEEADAAYPFIIHKLIPSGLKGLVFAALCGAIVSTIEALGHASATIFTFDIYKRMIKKEANDKQLIRAGRVTAAIVLLIGALWAPIVMQFGHIFSYFQECWAFIAIPVTVIFVLGVVWKKMNNTSAFYTLLLAFPMLILPYLLRMANVGMNVFNVAGIVLGFTLMFASVVAIFTGSGKEYKTNLIWNKKMLITPEEPHIKRKWYQSIGFWAIMLFILYFLLYFIFW